MPGAPAEVWDERGVFSLPPSLLSPPPPPWTWLPTRAPPGSRPSRTGVQTERGRHPYRSLANPRVSRSPGPDICWVEQAASSLLSGLPLSPCSESPKSPQRSTVSRAWHPMPGKTTALGCALVIADGDRGVVLCDHGSSGARLCLNFPISYLRSGLGHHSPPRARVRWRNPPEARGRRIGSCVMGRRGRMPCRPGLGQPPGSSPPPPQAPARQGLPSPHPLFTAVPSPHFLRL